MKNRLFHRAGLFVLAAGAAVCLRFGADRTPLNGAEALLPMSSELQEDAGVWTLQYGGKEWRRDTKVLDLTDYPVKDIEELEGCMQLLPYLERVILNGTGLPEKDLMSLHPRWPEITFVWDMKIGDVVFSTDAEEIDLTDVPLPSTSMIERRLRYLPNARKIILSNCGLSSEELDRLNRRHEDVKIVWTVKLGPMKVRTDETYFIPVKYRLRVETKDLEEFKYCTDMVCIDIGHMWVHNIDWAAYMPNLEYLILGETYITDISPLAGLKKLKYLELFTVKVDDFTPLLSCTGMEDLNLGLTYGDPDVIAHMTWLKNLWWCDANGYKQPGRKEAVKRMEEALTNTQIKIYIDHPTASGWRKLPNYYAMRDYMGMFYLD